MTMKSIVNIEGSTTERWSSRLPILLLVPSLVASFVYIFVFTTWTFYLSLSDSAQLPSYGFVGFENSVSLWANKRWNIAYSNLFFFTGFYVLGTMAVGLFLAILIDQRIRGESTWRTIFLYPLAVSFVVTGTVWSWLYDPTVGIEHFVKALGWDDFKFAIIKDRKTAIYAVILTGIWQASGFAMALFLAGLRSIDPDLVKAAQIDGASWSRTYRKVLLPVIGPIFIAVAVIMLQFAIKTYDLVAALTMGGPGISTSFPAMYVYDLMFQRGQIAEGAAAAIMMLLALAVILVPYGIYSAWQTRKVSDHD
jgi:glucose/mannose transport system permease protein